MMAFLWSLFVAKFKSLALSKVTQFMEVGVKSVFNAIVNFCVTLIGKIEWKQRHEITQLEKSKIKDALTSNYFIIVTRRGNHLSTYFIGLANFFLRGKWGYYSHVLMNLEDEVSDPSDFRLIEATGKGVNYNSFNGVFDGVDAVALLKPKGLELSEWTEIMDKAKTQLGKPYDTLFDLTNDQQLSCVELIRTALMSINDYSVRFSKFEEMINKSKNLTPQMFVDCADFEICFIAKG